MGTRPALPDVRPRTCRVTASRGASPAEVRSTPSQLVRRYQAAGRPFGRHSSGASSRPPWRRGPSGRIPTFRGRGRAGTHFGGPRETGHGPTVPGGHRGPPWSRCTKARADHGHPLVAADPSTSGSARSAAVAGRAPDRWSARRRREEPNRSRLCRRSPPTRSLRRRGNTEAVADSVPVLGGSSSSRPTTCQESVARLHVARSCRRALVRDAAGAFPGSRFSDTFSDRPITGMTGYGPGAGATDRAAGVAGARAWSSWLGVRLDQLD
jgi:hypothetical protein